MLVNGNYIKEPKVTIFVFMIFHIEILDSTDSFDFIVKRYCFNGSDVELDCVVVNEDTQMVAHIFLRAKQKYKANAIISLELIEYKS
jgi:hypothetical protein